MIPDQIVLREQFDLGPYCLQNIGCERNKQMTIVWNGGKSIKTSQNDCSTSNLTIPVLVLFLGLSKLINTIWNFYDIGDFEFHDIRDFEFHDIISL